MTSAGHSDPNRAASRPFSYSLVTPVLDEAENLRRLASAVCTQTILPMEWIIVNSGSTDGTSLVIESLASKFEWIRSVEVPFPQFRAARGQPIVRAFHAALGALTVAPDVLVKLDADLSFEPDYFDMLLRAFTGDESLGIAGGSCYEKSADGEWIQRFNTRDTVWGACRAYRWQCLQEILPLEERQGWDEIDSLKANLQGWSTKTLLDVPFRHHRRGGLRDGSRWSVWTAQGDVAHYLQYRPSYLVLRAVFNAFRERSALAMIWGYAAAFAGRKPRCQDVAVRRHLRTQQRLRALRFRAQEARGVDN